MSEASAKKRRKSEDPSAKSSKRQKTLDPNAPPAARNLPKASPVPFPKVSENAVPSTAPSTSTARAKASPVPSSSKKSKVVSTLPGAPTAAAANGSGMKRTPIMPPALSSPLKKPMPALAKKSSNSTSTVSLPKTVKNAQGATNGGDESRKGSPPKTLKRTPIKPPETENGAGKSAPKSSRKNKASSEGSESGMATDKKSKVKKPKKDKIKSDAHPDGNLDVTNEIAGRELPETGDATVVIEDDESAHMTMEKPSKKRKAKDKTPPKELPGSTEPESNDEEDEESSSSEGAKKAAPASEDVGPHKQHGLYIEPAHLKESRMHRDSVRGNLNVSKDFGLEGALHFPKDGLFNTGYHYFETYMYLDVPPIGVGYPLEAAVNLAVSKYLFDYFPPANGILLCHANHRICPPPKETEASLTKISAGYADNNLWVGVDLYIFRPTKGAWLRGTIGLQTETHIAILIMGHWSASVERKRLPKSWRWVPDDDDDTSLAEDDFTNMADLHLGGAGYWSDGHGKPAMGEVIIRALDFDMVNDNRRGGTVISIEASMLDEEDDKAADEIDELSQPRLLIRSPMYSRMHTPAIASSSKAVDVDAMEIDSPVATPVVEKTSRKKKGKQVATKL